MKRGFVRKVNIISNNRFKLLLTKIHTCKHTKTTGLNIFYKNSKRNFKNSCILLFTRAYKTLKIIFFNFCGKFNILLVSKYLAIIVIVI